MDMQAVDLLKKADPRFLDIIIASIRRRLGCMMWRDAVDGRQLKAVEKELEALISLYEAETRLSPRSKHFAAECIVFSKDRALQLHALLSSYFECVQHPAPVTVLYFFSNDQHQVAYEQVSGLFASRPVKFVRQRTSVTFGDQTLEILSGVKSDKIFFLVDDDLFIDQVDLADFVRVDPTRQVASLRLGACLSKSYVVSEHQCLPPWLPHSDAQRPDQLRWRWEEGQLEWGYPISLDGHLFNTNEISAMASVISFQSPNSLESCLQVFNKLFSRREGICYRNPILVNIPCNRVQDEIPNRFGGLHQEMLLEAWQQGMCMDYRALLGMRPESTHQEVQLRFVRRQDEARA
ncbi:MAG: hypothetical protein OJF50_006330 [Nitrospira sp.]|jgi:hypothetical protein|nr:hypothetical protein [Nitrospira sp.]